MARWNHAWHQRLRRILAELPSRTALEQREIRRTLAADPIAFALIYLRHHLRGKETGDRITFSEVHYEWARRAMSWREPMHQPMESRDAEVAPRSMGKTTWWFQIIPLWAGANEIVSFLAAFANTTGQAEGHLTTFKAELASNVLLRADFPEGGARAWRCRYEHSPRPVRLCRLDPAAHQLGDPCTRQQPCVDGAACVDGHCVAPPPAPACWLDTDCASRACRFGSCRESS